MASVARRSDRNYAAAITAGILLVVVLGFSRSFFLLPMFAARPEWAAPEPLFYLHGFVFSAWFALLGVQAWLIRARSTELHRRLGYFGAGLAVVIVALGTYSALAAANRPGGFFGVPLSPEQFVIVPLLDIATFAVFVTMGVIRRRRAASHKRWMLLAAITLLGAPVARLPLMAPVLPVFLDLIVYAVFVAVMIGWDYDTRRKITPETLWGGGAILVLKFFALPVAASAAWTSFALWAMSLVGPP